MWKTLYCQCLIKQLPKIVQPLDLHSCTFKFKHFSLRLAFEFLQLLTMKEKKLATLFDANINIMQTILCTLEFRHCITFALFSVRVWWLSFRFAPYHICSALVLCCTKSWQNEFQHSYGQRVLSTYSMIIHFPCLYAPYLIHSKGKKKCPFTHKTDKTFQKHFFASHSFFPAVVRVSRLNFHNFQKSGENCWFGLSWSHSQPYLEITQFH